MNITTAALRNGNAMVDLKITVAAAACAFSFLLLVQAFDVASGKAAAISSLLGAVGVSGGLAHLSGLFGMPLLPETVNLSRIFAVLLAPFVSGFSEFGAIVVTPLLMRSVGLLAIFALPLSAVFAILLWIVSLPLRRAFAPLLGNAGFGYIARKVKLLAFGALSIAGSAVRYMIVCARLTREVKAFTSFASRNSFWDWSHATPFANGSIVQ